MKPFYEHVKVAQFQSAESVACVRLKRRSDTRSVGFVSRPFVLCGLPIKRPPGTLLHESRHRRFVLQVAGYPSDDLPGGQDRLVPIFLAIRSTAKPNHHVYKCGRDAEVWHPTRRITISQVDRGVSADLWRNDFLRCRYTIRVGKPFSPRPF